MRPTTLCVALSAVLLSAGAWAQQQRPAPVGRTQSVRTDVKVRKASLSEYRLPRSFSGERCFEFRIRSRWDLCSP